MDIELRLWVNDKFATGCNSALRADVKIGPRRKAKGHVYNYTLLLAKVKKTGTVLRVPAKPPDWSQPAPGNNHKGLFF